MIGRLACKVSLAMAFAIAATPVAAQIVPPGDAGLGARPTFEIPRDRNDGRFVTRIRNKRETLRQVSGCIAARHPREVDALLALSPDDPQHAKTLSVILDLDCFVFERGDDQSIPLVNLPPLPLRGALFEAMYVRKFGKRPLPDLAAIPRIDAAAAYPGALTDKTRAAMAILDFGDCIAREAPDAATGLLRTVPESVAESAAIDALRPTLALCVNKGAAVTLARSTIRSAIAEALYRLSGGLDATAPR